MLEPTAIPERCSLCGETGRGDFNGRPRARCLDCGSLERHRTLVRTVGSALTQGHGRRALEAGPLNPRVYGGFLRGRGWSYVAIDRWKAGNPRDPRMTAFVDHQVDLVDLAPLADASFDLFLAQHVLEEIAEYERALDEIARVLRRGALAVIEIPFDPQLRHSRRQAPDHHGNVWVFGADLLPVVEARFERMQVLEMVEQPYSGRLLVCVR